MKIGRFWGFTAPMILLGFDTDDELLPLLRKLNTPMNQQVLTDLKIELLKMTALQNLTIVESPLETRLADLYGTEISINKGTLSVPENMDDQLVIAQLANEMCIMLAEMIIRGEQKGNYVDFSAYDNVSTALYDVIDRIISEETFQLDKLRSVIRKQYKSMLTDHGKSYTTELVNAFNLKLSVPDKIKINKDIVEPKDYEKRILQYFIDCMPRVYEILSFLNLGLDDEEQIFDTSFFDVIKRKPIGIQYMVLNRFDFLKSKQSKSLFLNILDDVKQDIAKYRECIAKYVEVQGTSNSYDVATPEYLNEALQNTDTEKFKFFNSLCSLKIMNLSDFLCEDVDALLSLYDKASSINAAALNERFSCDFSEGSWNEVGFDLCKFGLYGVNASTRKLFRESIETIAMTADDKVIKSEEDMMEINKVLGNVDALLSTLRPIGEVL